MKLFNEFVQKKSTKCELRKFENFPFFVLEMVCTATHYDLILQLLLIFAKVCKNDVFFCKSKILRLNHNQEINLIC